MNAHRRKQVVALSLMCVGIAFSVLAVNEAPNRTIYALVALANLCASGVFFMQLRANRRDGED